MSESKLPLIVKRHDKQRPLQRRTKSHQMSNCKSQQEFNFTKWRFEDKKEKFIERQIAGILSGSVSHHDHSVDRCLQHEPLGPLGISRRGSLQAIEEGLSGEAELRGVENVQSWKGSEQRETWETSFTFKKLHHLKSLLLECVLIRIKSEMFNQERLSQAVA